MAIWSFSDFYAKNDISNEIFLHRKINEFIVHSSGELIISNFSSFETIQVECSPTSLVEILKFCQKFRFSTKIELSENRFRSMRSFTTTIRISIPIVLGENSHRRK